MLKKAPMKPYSKELSEIKQHTLTLTPHEILPSLTPQNKPQTPPISPL